MVGRTSRGGSFNDADEVEVLKQCIWKSDCIISGGFGQTCALPTACKPSNKRVCSIILSSKLRYNSFLQSVSHMAPRGSPQHSRSEKEAVAERKLTAVFA
jgi:hypothetical protein